MDISEVPACTAMRHLPILLDQSPRVTSQCVLQFTNLMCNFTQTEIPQVQIAKTFEVSFGLYVRVCCMCVCVMCMCSMCGVCICAVCVWVYA